MKDLISVIVPVYKVEPYLDKCIESIVNQTYKNIEIILVDDGSPDNCPVMCDSWTKKDNRIKVIHKENGGLSDARNMGMVHATGEWIGFVDSDDWIEPDMYQLLHDKMVENNCDISCCGVQMDWEESVQSEYLTPKGDCVLDTEEAMRAIVQETWLKQPVWYKLYKSALIKGLVFPVGKCHEDVFWSYQAIGRAKSVCVFEKVCYHYVQRKESIMGEKYSLKRLDALEAKVKRYEYICVNMPQLYKVAKTDLYFFCMYIMQMLMTYCPKEIEHIGTERVYSVLKAYTLKLNEVDFEGLNIKQIIWLFMSKMSFDSTCKLRNILRIGI